MIIAGDYIDATFGAKLGISAMAAAGLGNLVSDTVGIGASGYIEAAADRMGLPDAKLSKAQLELPMTKFVNVGSNAIGIIIGCLLGMFPLLWIDDESKRLESFLSSQALLHHSRRVFDKYDSNHDGQLSTDELLPVIEELYELVVSQSQVAPPYYHHVGSSLVSLAPKNTLFVLTEHGRGVVCGQTVDE